jgi:hypothetical protein
MKKDDQLFFWENPFAIDPDTVGFRNAGGEFDARRAVELNPSRFDQFIACTTRSNPT